MRTYDDSVITNFDGLIINFHLWHDLIVPMNKRESVYASVDTNLIGAEHNVLYVSSTAGVETGTTIIDNLQTSPRGLNYAKVYCKSTDIGTVGETVVGATLIEVGSPFIPSATTMYFGICDASGVLIAKSGAVALEIAE